LLSLALPFAANGEFIHVEQGTLGQIPMNTPLTSNLQFDPNDPIASHPEMIKIATEIYERNARRGLTSPNVFSNTDRQLMLDLHNQIRSEVARGIYEGPSGTFQPAGCDMNALSWSTALEELATDWSDLCYFEHSSTGNCASRLDNLGFTDGNAEWARTDTDKCGENLYVSGAAPAMNFVSQGTNYGILGGIGDSWSAGESKTWNYQAGNFGSAGHYTQVVWANTRYVGCGFKTCNGVTHDDGSYSWAETMFTCNYYPPGNFNSQYPYTSGTACSCCDSDRHACTHDGGLCGGGWNTNYNNDAYSGDTSVVDACYDGTGRNVCEEAGQTDDSTNSGATTNPTSAPTSAPTRAPSQSPTGVPIVEPISNGDGEEEDSEDTYAMQVYVQTTWVSFEDDYSEVESTVEDLLFEKLAVPYLDVTATLGSDKQHYGPYCAWVNGECRYHYGFIKSPMTLQQVSEDIKDEISESISEGTFQDELCTELTAVNGGGWGGPLYCYSLTASVTSMSNGAFLGEDVDGDGESDIWNLETYSAGDMFLLILFLSLICLGCWCIGWTAHKRKFASDLQKEMQNAQSSGREEEIRKQLVANSQQNVFEQSISKFTSR